MHVTYVPVSLAGRPCLGHLEYCRLTGLGNQPLPSIRLGSDLEALLLRWPPPTGGEGTARVCAGRALARASSGAFDPQPGARHKPSRVWRVRAAAPVAFPLSREVRASQHTTCDARLPGQGRTAQLHTPHSALRGLK